MRHHLGKHIDHILFFSLLRTFSQQLGGLLRNVTMFELIFVTPFVSGRLGMFRFLWLTHINYNQIGSSQDFNTLSTPLYHYLNFYINLKLMWLLLVKRVQYCNSELGARNTEFFNRVKSHQKKFNLHQKTMHIKQEEIDKWAASNSKKELTEKIVREAKFDEDVKQYIKKFNQEHKGRINLLDFSNYTTKFNDFKENPISKKDMEVIREFQKRKIDQRLHSLRTERFGKQKEEDGTIENPLEYQKDVEEDMKDQDDQIEMNFVDDFTSKQLNIEKKRLFEIDDEFIMLILERNICTKVTTLNRVNYYRTLLFMANGNGLISYGKSRDLTPELSLTKAIMECRKNIIALPLDHTCTMPRPINSRFQDFHIYLRPLPGFNSWGHPMFSLMLSLTGISHVGFKTVHTGKNNYTMLHSFFKAVTQNTTPQDMAELQGFKLYRRRFIRPLTEQQTHNLSY